MNRIAEAFRHGKAFIGFVTCGDPDIETTEKLVVAMEQAGADLVELGIPFSDPIAEGPVIQAADGRALKGGFTCDALFPMVRRLRKTVRIPLVVMTYLNPVFVYGKDKFVSLCQESGVDGLIIPDEPFEEKDEMQDICTRHGVKLISMIAPTSQERIARIAKEAEGFVYCVSSLGVTGVRTTISDAVADMVREVKRNRDIPCAIGFGVSTPEQAEHMASFSDGVIVGSAIVRIVAEHGRDSVPFVAEYVRSMKQAAARACTKA